MHGVAGAVGDDAADNLLANQGEIADEIENFVADEFIGEAQRAIAWTLGREDNHVLIAGAADEAHVAQIALILKKAKGARGRDFALVASGREINFEVLCADGRGEVDGIGDGVSVGGIDADEFIALANLNLLQDSKISALAALAAQAGSQNHFDEALSAAIKNRDFEIIELYGSIIEADADEGRKQVLRGRDEHAFFHQAGGVADARDVAAERFDFVVVEIYTAKDNAGAGSRRQDPQVNGSAAVQADALTLYSATDCLLIQQGEEASRYPQQTQ